MNIKKRIQFVSQHIHQIGFFSTVHYFFQRVVKAKSAIVKVIVAGLQYPVLLRNKTYDVHIFYQIFIAEELQWDYEGDIRTIIDCGANIGLSTLFYKRKFPGAAIISVEPEMYNFELLANNVKNYHNILPLHTGVYGYDGELYLVDIGEGEASYRVLETPGTYAVIDTISCRSIDSIMQAYQLHTIDILKMDIEGSEYACLLSPQKLWLDKIKYLLVEIHENLYPGITAKIHQSLPSTFEINSHGEYTVIHKSTHQ